MTSQTRAALQTALDTDIVDGVTDGITTATVRSLVSDMLDSSVSAVNDQTGTTYTLLASDAAKVLRQANASAITTTVPASTIPAGQRILIIANGAGAITLSASGVTINNNATIASGDAALLVAASATEFDFIGLGSTAVDPDTLFADTADVLTAGFAQTPYNAGTKTTGTFTPDEANGNMQYAVNGGAHTLAPPTNSCSIHIQYTNDGSAGTITTSGFTIVTGDTPTTTDGDDFFYIITKNNGFSHLHIVTLQ